MTVYHRDTTDHWGISGHGHTLKTLRDCLEIPSAMNLSLADP